MRRHLFLLLTTALLCSSCEELFGDKDNTEIGTEAAITLGNPEETNFIIDYLSQTINVRFTATSHWHAASEAAWLTLSPEFGEEGEYLLSINIEANESNESRTAEVILSDATDRDVTLTIEQRANSTNDVKQRLASMSRMMNSVSSVAYDHSDFGYHSVRLNTDFMAMLTFPCTMPERGGNTAYSRFQFANYGYGLGTESPFAKYVWATYTTLIDHVNKIIDGSKHSDEMAQYEGAGRAFRALFYLDMACLYDALPAKDPKNPSYESALASVEGLTVPIVTEDMSKEQRENNPRATREEMFEFILCDLDLAEELLGDNKIDMQAMPNLAAIYALKARTYLWLGGFDESYANIPTSTEAYRLAAEYARKAITEATKMSVAITTSSEWLNPFYAFSTKMPSWIWATKLEPSDVPSNLHAFAAHMCPEALYGYGPLTGVGVSSTMYERLGENDFRRLTIAAPDVAYENFSQYTQMSQEEWEEQRYCAPYTNFKFRPGNGEREDYIIGNAIAIPIIRIEEMYFIEAEATAHYDEGSGAMLLETFMRNYRDVSYTFSGSDIIEEIIFQKSAEFWGEGIVMFDMKRLDMGIDTTNANYPIDMQFRSEGRLPRWNFVIPKDAMDENKGITECNPDPSNTNS